MNQKIKDYVEELFETAPKTHRIFELKEELRNNLNERYNDLLAVGKSEEDALAHVKSSIGDVSELISGVEESAALDLNEVNKWRKKTAMVVSVAVSMYICSIAVVLLFSLSRQLEEFGPIAMFIMIAGATGMLIYHFMSMPKHIKSDNTVVEEFKEWQSNKSKAKEIEDALSSILWIGIIAIYFIISFAFHMWAVSWIIFIIGAALQRIISLMIKLKR